MEARRGLADAGEDDEVTLRGLDDRREARVAETQAAVPRFWFDVPSVCDEAHGTCDGDGIAVPVIGFAADGFPIYGTCFNDNGTVRKAVPSYQLKMGGGAREDVSGYTTPVGGRGSVVSSNYDGQFRGDYEYVAGSGDLDECNGMVVNGQYGYFITDAYPWVLGCYSGTPDESFSMAMGPPPGR